MKIDLKASIQSYHTFVKEFNKGKTKGAILSTSMIYTGEMLVRIFADNYNAGKCQEYTLNTTSYGLATILHQSERNVRRHWERLNMAGIITELHHFKSIGGYAARLNINLQIVQFKENDNQKTIEERILSGKLKPILA